MRSLLLACGGACILCCAFRPSFTSGRGTKGIVSDRPTFRLIRPFEKALSAISGGEGDLKNKKKASKVEKTPNLAKNENRIENLTQSVEYESNPALTPAQSRLVLLCIAAAYGTNYAAIKDLSNALDPAWASLLRFSTSAAVFAPTMWRYRGEEEGFLEAVP